MSGFRLRYREGSPDALRFASITYPTAWHPPYPTRERAEVVRQAMPDPSKFEIVEED